MNLFEVYFWNAVFWLMYLPSSLIIYFVTWSGTILGFIGIGVGFSLLLSFILAPMEELLFEERIQPRRLVVATLPKATSKQSSTIAPDPQPENKRRGRPPKNHEKVDLPKEKSPEVKQDEKQEEKLFAEPQPKMETDVDLRKLNASDDDNYS